MPDPNNSKASVRAPGAQMPDLHPHYNHDLDVSDAFRQNYSLIADVIRDGRLLEQFQYYESKAKSHKLMFHALGVGSLLLGLLTLASAAVGTITGDAIMRALGSAWTVAAGGSVGAVVLISWNRLRRHRVLWCQAVFCRERLRQWHFQVFLDGRLMGLLPSNPAQFRAELDRRWATLQQNFLDGYGIMMTFVRHGSRAEDFFHQPSPYADAPLLKVALETLWTLRLEHQLRFSHRKTDPEPEKAGMALEERSSISESIATLTLSGAVLVGAIGGFIALSQGFPSLRLFAWNAEMVNKAVGGTSLLLAVISAACRAYRAGYTLPDESESYEEYCDRLHDCKAIFENAITDDEKLKQLEKLEQEAASELRRFLRMKMRATFVF